MKRIRRFWWKQIRRYRCEICEDCGRPVEVVWHASDKLWLRLCGKPSGLLCVRCFDHRSEKDGLLLYWLPVVECENREFRWRWGEPVPAEHWGGSSVEATYPAGTGPQ